MPADTWKIDDHPRRQYPRVTDSQGRFIADCDTEEHARLIAAAPELLEALQELSDLVELIRAGNYQPDSFTTQPARAAIAKATAT